MHIKAQTILPEGTVITKCPRGKAAGIPQQFCKTSTKGKSRAAVAATRVNNARVAQVARAQAAAVAENARREAAVEEDEVDRAFERLMMLHG